MKFNFNKHICKGCTTSRFINKFARKVKLIIIGGKLTLEEIQAEYHESDVCMGELLVTLPARGLNMEEAFELNIAARKWAYGDEFYRVIDGEEPEKL